MPVLYPMNAGVLKRFDQTAERKVIITGSFIMTDFRLSGYGYGTINSKAWVRYGRLGGVPLYESHSASSSASLPKLVCLIVLYTGQPESLM